MAIARSPTQYKGVRAIQPPDLIIATRAPTSTDIAYPPGQLWLDKTNAASYQFTGATWISLGSGTTGSINTITGDTGGAKTPLAGNFSLLGTASQITVTGGSNRETFSIPAAFIAPGSITSTTTIASGTTLAAGTSMSAGTTITAGTTLTATLGNITATNGNIVKGTAGNKDVYSSVATTTTAGANSAGTVTLVGGTATISTTSVAAGSKIRLTRQGVGSTAANPLGLLAIGTISAGTSFIINAWSSTDATALATTDVSSIFWEIVN